MDRETMTVRMPKADRFEAGRACASEGVTFTAAVDMLLAQMAQTGRIPFDFRRAALQQLREFERTNSMELGDRMRAKRPETTNTRVNVSISDRSAAEDVCRSLGVSLSSVIRLFAKEAAIEGRVPLESMERKAKDTKRTMDHLARKASQKGKQEPFR